jgi:hypothetical protein
MDQRRNLLARMLAGLQVGILGGLATIAWLLALSEWYFSGPWALLNLFAILIRRGAPWTNSFSFGTLAGGAMHLFACGVLGMFVGWVLPRPNARSRRSLAGAAFGAVLSLMVYEFFWRRHLPRLNDHISPFAILVIHAILGVCIGMFPRFYLQLAPGMPQIESPEAPQE